MEDASKKRARGEDEGKPKLYTAPHTRGVMVQWALDELNLTSKFEIIQVDFTAKQHKTQEYLDNVHPFGRVPALVDGDFKLFDSSAILLYLADKYGEAATPEQRAELASWVTCAGSTIGEAVWTESVREEKMPECLKGLEKTLEGKQFLLDNKFSLADVAVSAVLIWARAFFPDKIDFSPYPKVCAYVDAMKSREHCAKYF